MANISKRRICVVQSHVILVPRANWVGGKHITRRNYLLIPLGNLKETSLSTNLPAPLTEADCVVNNWIFKQIANRS